MPQGGREAEDLMTPRKFPVLALVTFGWMLFVWGAAPTATADSDTHRAQRASAALMAVLRLDVPTEKEVTSLIEGEHFDEFENRVHRYERRFDSDPLWESPLSKLFFAIDGGNKDLKEKLDHWVNLRPSYISRAARGAYEVSLGYKQRGDRYIAETPSQNLAMMEATLGVAREDLEKALELNSKFPPAYVLLLRVAQAVGGTEAAAAIERRATREVPTTYYVRHEYLMNLRPRWGGSYEQMTRYAHSLTSAADLNPRIWSLNGESWGELAFTACCTEHDDAAAIRYYTVALHYGDRLEFLKSRGTLYLRTHRYDLALKDFQRYRDYYALDEEVNRYAVCLKTSDGSGCTPAPSATDP